MKYLITKIDIKHEGGDSEVLKESIETDDIEETRRELHQLYNCDRVLLSYEEVE